MDNNDVYLTYKSLLSKDANFRFFLLKQSSAVQLENGLVGASSKQNVLKLATLGVSKQIPQSQGQEYQYDSFKSTLYHFEIHKEITYKFTKIIPLHVLFTCKDQKECLK